MAFRELKDMQPPIEGGCRCGQVRYCATAAAVFSGYCHCRACQQLSGAPFVSALSVPADSFSLRGDTVAFRRDAESGHAVTTTHCARCGTRICAQSTGNTALMAIFAATLRNPAIFKPLANVYLSDAAPWTATPPARFNFQKMPVWDR